jgi:hypothetical protein
VRCMNMSGGIDVVSEIVQAPQFLLLWPVQLIKIFGTSTDLTTQLEV